MQVGRGVWHGDNNNEDHNNDANVTLKAAAVRPENLRTTSVRFKWSCLATNLVDDFWLWERKETYEVSQSSVSHSDVSEYEATADQLPLGFPQRLAVPRHPLEKPQLPRELCKPNTLLF